MHWEGEAQHRDRAELGRRAAGDSGASRAPPEDDRQPIELTAAEPLDDRRPSRVQLPRRCRRLATGHHVRLLHERHGDARVVSGLGGGSEVRRADSARGAVAQDQAGRRTFDRPQVNARRSMGCVDLEDSASLVSGHRNRPPHSD